MRIPSATLADRLRNPIAYAVDPIRVISDMAARYGDIVRFMPPMSPFDAIVVNRPEWIFDILERQPWNFSIMRVLSIDRALNQGLLTSHGYLHQHQRGMLAEPFHAWVPTATEMIAGHGRALRDRWQTGAEVDMRTEMLRLAVDVSADAVFGSDFMADRPDLREAGIVVCYYLSRPSTHPFASAKEFARVLPDNRRFWAAMRLIDAELERLIAERRANEGSQADLLGLLLDVGDPETGDRMPDRQVRDECMTLFTAGAAPMGWELARAWYLISQNPDADERFAGEVERVGADGGPTHADVHELVYTRMILQETLRLYPSAWLVGRRVINDFPLDSYVLPAGSIAVMSSYVTQRDARFFPDPVRFLPERWATDGAAQVPAGAYYPWGGGPRSCFGEPLAMLAMTTLLAVLAQTWRPRSVAGRLDAYQARFTLLPKDPLLMRLERR